MKKKFKQFVICFNLFVLIFASFSIKPMFINGTTLTIDDFSEFSIYNNTPLVTSEKNSNQITMIYNGENGEYSWETYLNDFSALGNISDFNIEITIEYSYSGSMLMQAGINIGSHYYENGTYGGSNLLNRICGCGIWDAWSSSDGKYYVNARPFDINNQYESYSGSLEKSGIVTLQLTRTSNVVEATIIKQGNVKLTQTWNEGLTRPLNYIHLIFSIDPVYCTYTSIAFTSITALMNQISDLQTIFLGPSRYIIGLMIFLNLTVIFIYRKSRNRNF